MLTKAQKRTLATMVRQNQGVLFAKFGPHVTRKKKEAVWEAIRQRLISMGADLPDVRYVRDFEWGNLKRAATKRSAENRMTELDQIVMDTVTGNSSSCGDTESESIEVTPTIYQNYSGVDDFGQQDGLTSESNSGFGTFNSSTPLKTERKVTSKFTRIHPSSTYNDVLTNGRNHFAVGDNDPLTTAANEGDYPDFQDPELIFLSKQKLLLENEHIQLQMNDLRERGRREREKFRLELEKTRAEIEREKATTEKVKEELIVMKLRAKEIKARTEYFEAAKQSIVGKQGGESSVDPLVNNGGQPSVSETVNDDTD